MPKSLRTWKPSSLARRTPSQGARQGLLHSQLLDGPPAAAPAGASSRSQQMRGELDGHGHPRLLTAADRVGGRPPPRRRGGRSAPALRPAAPGVICSARRTDTVRAGGAPWGFSYPHPRGVVLPGFPLRRAGALLGELLQHLPPQGVQGGQGEGKGPSSTRAVAFSQWNGGTAGAAQLALHLLPGEGGRSPPPRAPGPPPGPPGPGRPPPPPGLAPPPESRAYSRTGVLAVLPALIGGAGPGQRALWGPPPPGGCRTCRAPSGPGSSPG